MSLLIRYLPEGGVLFSGGDPPNGIITIGFHVVPYEDTQRVAAALMVDPSWSPEKETPTRKDQLGDLKMHVFDHTGHEQRETNELGTPLDCVPVDTRDAARACADAETRGGLWITACQNSISTAQQAIETYTCWPVGAAYSLLSELEDAFDELKGEL